MSMPAVVKFIGNEEQYRLGCDDLCCFYCRDCEKHGTCQKTVQSLFTFGKLYSAYFVEYWQGKRNSLHVQGNDSDIHDFVPLEDFEILSDSDGLLNDYEATVRCITHAYDDGFFGLTYGKNYTAIGKDQDGLFLVMDDSYDCYFYSADCFEIVEDKHGILSRQSVYYSFHGKN